MPRVMSLLLVMRTLAIEMNAVMGVGLMNTDGASAELLQELNRTATVYKIKPPALIVPLRAPDFELLILGAFLSRVRGCCACIDIGFGGHWYTNLIVGSPRGHYCSETSEAGDLIFILLSYTRQDGLRPFTPWLGNRNLGVTPTSNFSANRLRLYLISFRRRFLNGRVCRLHFLIQGAPVQSCQDKIAIYYALRLCH